MTTSMPTPERCRGKSSTDGKVRLLLSIRLLLSTAVVALLCLILARVSDARVAEVSSDGTPTVTIEPDPVFLTANGTGANATGKIELTAKGIAWSELTIRALPLTLGKNDAFIKFSQADSADSVSLGDSRIHCTAGQPCSVDIEAVGVNARGTYTGTVDVYSATAKLATVTVNVLLPDPVFDPSISGDALKNDVLSINAERADGTLLTIASPSGSPGRTYKLETSLAPSHPGTWLSQLIDRLAGCAAGQEITALNVDPSTFSLEGGASRPVVIRAPECLKVGMYEGEFTISDATSAALSRSKALTVSKEPSEEWRRLMILWWVVIGAALSVALNNAFPLNRARGERFNALLAIDANINGLGAIGPELRGSLRSEGRRLWLLIETVTFLNPQKNAIVAEAREATLALATLVESAMLINALRADCESGGRPIRILLAIEVQLRAAEQALIRADVASSQAPIAAARALSDADVVAATLADALSKDIDKLLTERPNGGDAIPPAGRDADAREASRAKAVMGGRPAAIAQRVLQLEVDQKTLASMAVEDLLAIERDFYIANVWTDIMEFALRADRERFAPMMVPFLAQLEATPAALHTQLLIALLRSNLSPGDIQSALAVGEAGIVSNDCPRYLDLESFGFEFSNPALKNVAAARQLPCYKWEFDDHASRPDDGEQCKHFFLPPGRLARVWRFVSLQGPQTREVQVTVTMPSLSHGIYTFKKVLRFRAQRDHTSSLTATQVMTFIITTATAVLAAYGTQYGNATPETIGWSACISALLFGFGIDQVRDRAASS
jgi:hypothetical protein